MSTFGSYGGTQLLQLELKPRSWLVEGIAREQDAILLVGNEKSGKSLFALQLICSLTSQQPFMGKWQVAKPCRVTYLQLEGELNDTQDRLKRMIRTQSFEPELLHLMFYPPQELQEKSYSDGLADTILKFWNPEAKNFKDITTRPDVVIIDPIYFAFSGSLSDDDTVRRFMGNLRTFKERLGNCAIILLHHTHKQKWDFTGNVINEGDEATFGSKFLKAWADHILLFLFDKATGVRTLCCNTQRSGDIIKECCLELIEPEPLYFKETTNRVTNKEEALVTLLKLSDNVNGLTINEIAHELSISEKTFYNAVNPLVKSGIIEKDSTKKPVIYKYAKRD